MRFFDNVTRNALETDNEVTIAQFKKNPERYSEAVEIKEPEKPDPEKEEPEASTETIKKAGRPPKESA